MSTNIPSIDDNSNKRHLSPESIQITNNKSKAYKATMNDISELKQLISESKSDIEKKISDSQTSIETKLNDFKSTFSNEVQSIKSSVDEFKSAIGNDIDTIKIHIQEHSKRLDNTDDDINRLKLAADLRVIGFPYTQNENLFELFSNIASIIGYDYASHISVPLMERIPIRNKTTGVLMPSPTILFHFTSVHIKQHFYALYLNKMPLKPESFGLPKESRIVLGENLSQKNAFLFKKAQTMRNEKKLAQVFTTDGLVKIKFARGPEHNAFTIRNSLELECLVAQHGPHAMEHESPNSTQSSHSNPLTQPMHHEQEQQHMNSSIEMLPNELKQAQNTQSNGTTTPASNNSTTFATQHTS